MGLAFHKGPGSEPELKSDNRNRKPTFATRSSTMREYPVGVPMQQENKLQRASRSGPIRRSHALKTRAAVG